MLCKQVQHVEGSQMMMCVWPTPRPSFTFTLEEAADSDRLKQIADRLQEIGSDDAEPRATKILRGG